MELTFVLGAIAMAAFTASLFFLRFWAETRDPLFLMFAISFFLEAVNRTALAHMRGATEAEAILYGIRALAYGLILVAIIHKNLKS